MLGGPHQVNACQHVLPKELFRDKEKPLEVLNGEWGVGLLRIGGYAKHKYVGHVVPGDDRAQEVQEEGSLLSGDAWMRHYGREGKGDTGEAEGEGKGKRRGDEGGRSYRGARICSHKFPSSVGL